VKTRIVVGYIAVAFAYAYGCGGSSPSFSPTSTTDDGGTDDGGAAESGGGDGELTVTDARVTDARAGDARERDASGGSEGGADDGATNAAPYYNSNQSCCVSGAYYVCPSAAALARCASACTHDPSGDATCLSFDGGSAVFSGGGSAPAPPAPQTNACGGFFLGITCMVGGQCYGGNEHCTQNTCYLNDVGNPCTYPNDCGAGNHCSAGCCANSAKGSPCDAPWDCKSNTCTSHVCQ